MSTKVKSETNEKESHSLQTFKLAKASLSKTKESKYFVNATRKKCKERESQEQSQ